MGSQEITGKERWLLSIGMKPVDRLIFWPKLEYSYLAFRRKSCAGLNEREAYEWIGSDFHGYVPGVLVDRRSDTSYETVTDGNCQTITYRVGNREMRMVKRYDPVSMSWHPTEAPIKSVEDVKLMTEWYGDIENDYDKTLVAEAKAVYDEVGDKSLCATTIGESPLMLCVEWLAGVERAHYLLYDYRDEMEALFDAIHRDLLKKAEIVCAYSPADAVYMVENTSTTLISPAQYEKYCLGQINEYGGIVRGSGKKYMLHMCGHLRKLLPLLSRTNADAFEAFTPPTVGDTSFTDGRAGCPDKCFLGGTNAEMLISTPARVTGYLEKQFESLPHCRGIIVTSGGMTPQGCEPEFLREVCGFVKNYPASF